MDAVGIFRKSGGKQRINHLKEMIEGDPGITVFHISFQQTFTSRFGCNGKRVFNLDWFWLIWWRCPSGKFFQPFLLKQSCHDLQHWDEAFLAACLVAFMKIMRVLSVIKILSA